MMTRGNLNVSVLKLKKQVKSDEVGLVIGGCQGEECILDGEKEKRECIPSMILGVK